MEATKIQGQLLEKQSSSMLKDTYVVFWHSICRQLNAHADVYRAPYVIGLPSLYLCLTYFFMLATRSMSGVFTPYTT